MENEIEAIRTRHEARSRVISQAYASPWREAEDDISTLLQRVQVLDEALTITCDERDAAYAEIDAYNGGADFERTLLLLGAFLNACWSAFDDSQHGGKDADGEEVVSIPAASFLPASEAMDALDAIASVGTGWLGYRVKAMLRAAALSKGTSND